MDAAALRQRVEEEMGTELERIGSNKLLVALTDADLSTGAVLRAAADSEHAAHNTFAGWADHENDPAARELFGWVADREAEHRDRVLETLDADYEPNDGGTMHSYLREREDTIERVAAGLVGRPLVSVRSHLQIVSHFVNEADEAGADLFREFRTETEEELERGLAYLDDHCEHEEDWESAEMVASYTVQVAYDDYADSLEGLGIDVKPVC
ncbi:rubrerythrin family protein [Halorarum halophilum]|uniref:Rubrerythrin family protein n=1 Tax=Halorarum halophilum TaxID=2743090 RepID=A0A7D5KWZ5_9EURY|nr:rubrerythrin family protein [Halobaculum halophilum]QLG27458.1 rubrerythrin family protein [Halobaculum halophilum]